MPELRRRPLGYQEERSWPHFQCAEQRSFQKKMVERKLGMWFQGLQKVSGRELEIQEPSESDWMKLPRRMYRKKEKLLGNKPKK